MPEAPEETTSEKIYGLVESALSVHTDTMDEIRAVARSTTDEILSVVNMVEKR